MNDDFKFCYKFLTLNKYIEISLNGFIEPHLGNWKADILLLKKLKGYLNK